MKEAYLGRGNVYVSKGDLLKARRDYVRVAHLFPRCPEAYINIAYTYQMEGKSKMVLIIFISCSNYVRHGRFSAIFSAWNRHVLWRLKDAP